MGAFSESYPSSYFAGYIRRHSLRNISYSGNFSPGWFQAEEIYVSGGASKLWLQIHADVADIPIYLTTVEEASTLGTAIYAAVGVGFMEVFPKLPSKWCKYQVKYILVNRTGDLSFLL